MTPAIPDARSGGMGLARTAIVQGPWSVAGNPAQLGGLGGFGFSASIILDQVSEERSIEAIDQFNDVVTKNIYASNTNSFRKYAAALGYGFELFAVAYAMVPIHDYGYKYSEEIRLSLSSSYYNRDPLAGYHILEMSGQVMGNYLGVSTALGPLSLGGSFVLYTANDLLIDKAVSVISVDDALASDTSYRYQTTHKLEESTLGMNLGLSYEVNDDISLHYVIDKTGDLTFLSNGFVPYADSTLRYPEYRMADSSLQYTLEKPAVHRFGIAFSPGQKQRTLAVFELELHQGQTITYSESFQSSETFDYDLGDTRIYHVGLEHWASATLPLRMGYSYEESSLDKSLSMTQFTVGGSLIHGSFQVDMSGQVSSLGYSYPDIFPPAGTSSIGTNESVNESVLSLLVTASYKLP
ncbi:MAG: hypothetical protein K9N38_06315 [Candidatus Marinimicrobia bacterium]|nr:hypothetical protein [Candidatus Neomarinimicrobiota bacterium]MCF7850878.1 hypothetical protein [Candidatus Neomarinimicrobiota bacterium]